MADPLPTLLRRLRLERALSAHTPTLIGARALKLSQSGPVIILCQAGRGFTDRLRTVYGDHPGFTRLTDGDIEGCTFTLMNTPIQIIGRRGPVKRHREWQIFHLQIRLLRLLGAPLQEKVLAGLRARRSLERAFAEAMDVPDLMKLTRASGPILQECWAHATRPRPTQHRLPAPVEPEPASEPEPTEDDLLRRPAPLLKERVVTWIDPARLLPVSRHHLPPPMKKIGKDGSSK